MRIEKARVQELKNQTYGTLQSTPEYRYFLDNYIYNKSTNMTSEVDYILNKSTEDNEAPFSYEDFQQYSINNENLIEEALNEFDAKDEEDQKEFITYINEAENRRIKNIGDYEVFLKSLLSDSEEDLHDFIINNTELKPENFEELNEVYQWFLMDDRIIYQLEQRGEIILNKCYWGRQCCGQAIELDYIIIQIFKEWFLDFSEIKTD